MQNIIKRWSLGLGLGLCASGLTAPLAAENYLTRPEGKAFVERMVTEHKLPRDWVEEVLGQAEKQPAILELIARPAERVRPWYEYRTIFLDEARIAQGVEFWDEHQDFLKKTAQQYAVEPEIIVAIIGVETRYVRHMGRHRVLDALATLGFDYPPRATFFARELEQFLLLVREQQQDPLTLKGSYAGAMGYGQFIPSSYRHYARDGDGDGIVDIWTNPQDAIASVANYFKAHGWQTGKPVVARAKVQGEIDQALMFRGRRPEHSLAHLKERGVSTDATVDQALKAFALSFQQPEGPEYWIGFNNFYVITRYNRSPMYAMAVWQLSEAIQAARLQGENDN